MLVNLYKDPKCLNSLYSIQDFCINFNRNHMCIIDFKSHKDNMFHLIMNSQFNPNNIWKFKHLE